VLSPGSINLSWHFLHFLISAPQRACSLLPPDFSKYVAFMAELKLREHEGRGEYITVCVCVCASPAAVIADQCHVMQRIRIEDVFARVYGPVERNDGDPCGEQIVVWG
jgi:hypothetical protein